MHSGLPGCPTACPKPSPCAFTICGSTDTSHTQAFHSSVCSIPVWDKYAQQAHIWVIEPHGKRSRCTMGWVCGLQYKKTQL